ncbi:MAG TPA: 16S rRNA (guanine(527)-N(7))-methyltransferase RsmG [Chloroflexi bacterium]|jgi:16S rRNA (guanine527-N7)-methyltransferase|nr:16S rRNA (guanine(527)-N(7))-methyltransferase RsmG [Chloroflexota bacterium]
MELLRAGAASLGLTLGASHLRAFETYYRELAAWNQQFNLTAITGYQEVQRRHFLDSLSCLLALPVGAPAPLPDEVAIQVGSGSLRVADVGSGAGFPGLPLKIMLPDARVTLIEATGKKAAFLQHMVRLLGLQGVEVLAARAEDVGRMPEHREQYDLVVARAVAPLGVLAEYCLPLCRLQRRMVAQKGSEGAEEAEAALPAIARLGGALISVKSLAHEALPPGRTLVVIDKVARTPEAYPRRPGIPSKRPLA